MLVMTLLPGPKPSCTTVSLTKAPSGSRSKETLDRGSWEKAARSSSLTWKWAAHSGVNVCHV